MTNFRQSLHVMAKDLRESRLLLAAFLMVTVFLTAGAVAPSWLGDPSGSLLAFIMVPVSGMIVVASFVQGDSPTRADAFWASRPLNPSAVFAAKVVLTVAIVLAIPLAGQLAALLARHADSDIVAASMAASAWAYAKWLILAFVLAAMTKDLKTFVLALAVIPVALITLFVWAATHSHGSSPQPIIQTHANHIWALGVISAGTLGCFALLVYLYRTRDSRPWTWAVALVLLFLLQADTGPVQTRAERTDVPAGVARTTFGVDMSRSAGSMNGVARYSLELTPDSLPALQRLAVVSGTAVITGRRGTTARQLLDQFRVDMPLGVHALTDVTWLNEPSFSARALGAGITGTDSVQTVLDQGIAKVGLDARVLVRVPGAADTLDLRVGATVSRRGTRMVLKKWSFGPGRATVGLSVSSVPANFDATGRNSMNDDQAEFALVNEKRHEAVALASNGGSGSSGFLVLPGTQVSTGEQTFEVRPQPSHPGFNDQPISDDWFREARLVISHWVSVGSYPIHAENVNPSQPPSPPARR